MPPQLPLNELEPIRDALLAAFLEADFSLFLSGKLGVAFDDIASAAANPTRPKRYQAALEWLNTRRRIPELLAAAFEERAQDPAVAALHAKHRADILDVQRNVDHYLACRVSSGLGMVDRDNLRSEMKRLKEDKARILLVAGPATSGKTYMRLLLDYVADKTGDFKPLYLDLIRLARRDPQNMVDPDAFAERMAALIGADPPEPIGQRTGNAWAGDTYNWLVRVLGAQPQTTYWLVIDHLSKVALRPGVEELFIEIALGVDEDLRNLRLILIDYKPEMGQALSSLGLVRPLRSETVPPISIEKLAEFFDAVYKERELLTQRTATAEEIGNTVARCWNITVENDPVRLKRLGEEISVVLEELFA